MAATVQSLANMPYWPLMLSDEQAAAYVGLSRESFRRAVDSGDYPHPVRSHGRRVLWYRPGLDQAAAELAGLRIAANDRPIEQSEIDQWAP